MREGPTARLTSLPLRLSLHPFVSDPNIGNMNLNINLESLKNMVDEAKNQIVPRTEMEKRMHEALSNKNWGASSTLMNQIASDTYDYEK